MEQINKTLLLLISHSCNLNCKYCYEWFKDSRRMSWEQAVKILENEFQHDDEPIESVDLLGGEPLLNFEIIPKICNWIWERFPNTRIFARTNGTLLSESMKEWFSSNRHRFILGLSIDGMPEVNFINRGIRNIDIEYFRQNWPDNPVKMTIFPNSVHLLVSSLKYLYNKNFKVIGGLAQGVKWDNKHCCELEEQLSVLTDFYLCNSAITPLEPLYDLNFDKAFWIPTEDAFETPCWKQANIHTYDCDGGLLPCHMFSSIVQGKEKRQSVLHDMQKVNHELLPVDCQTCPIRWCCKNCMAMNYQHTGNFGDNINLKLMCDAQKIAASASAEFIVRRAMDNTTPIDSQIEYEAVSNAIRFLKIRGKM